MFRSDATATHCSSMLSRKLPSISWLVWFERHRKKRVTKTDRQIVRSNIHWYRQKSRPSIWCWTANLGTCFGAKWNHYNLKSNFKSVSVTVRYWDKLKFILDTILLYTGTPTQVSSSVLQQHVSIETDGLCTVL